MVLTEGRDWQIFGTRGEGRALVTEEGLASRWIEVGLIDKGAMDSFSFGGRQCCSLTVAPSESLALVSDGKAPSSKSEALAFAIALKETRAIDAETPLQDGIYVESLSRILPTYSISSKTNDDVVLGYWLTGGAAVPATSVRRLAQMVSWASADALRDVVQAAGLGAADSGPAGRGGNVALSKMDEEQGTTAKTPAETRRGTAAGDSAGTFKLPGRPELEAFFNEHVIDIIQNRDRYRALGIAFPSAVVLHGPPGCGKTFAVERLVDFLGWPCFQIDASSVGSPYIHETSRKVAQVFEQAIESAPSVITIDEMESFLADREMGSGSSHHRVEEVAEFLRRIPEATKNEVLIVAMTNRIEMIDPAILRRGRFDHIIRVDMATRTDVQALIEKLVSELPHEDSIDFEAMAERLEGRPLSDVAFVVREGARLAARAGQDRVSEQTLTQALDEAPSRGGEDAPARRIGFV